MTAKPLGSLYRKFDKFCENGGLTGKALFLEARSRESMKEGGKAPLSALGE